MSCAPALFDDATTTRLVDRLRTDDWAMLATAVAISVARKADTASCASDQRGRLTLSSVSTPIIMPSM